MNTADIAEKVKNTLKAVGHLNEETNEQREIREKKEMYDIEQYKINEQRKEDQKKQEELERLERLEKEEQKRLRQTNLETLTVHSYSWNLDDSGFNPFANEENLEVRSWCLNRDSVPHLIRIVDFPAICSIELPLFIGGKYITWNDRLLKCLYDWFKLVLKEDQPINTYFVKMKKLYYCRTNSDGTQRTYPVVIATFKTEKAMHHCENLLGKVNKIEELGLVSLKVWESDISTIRKMLTHQEVGFSQWFEIKGYLVAEDEHRSTLKNEYICSFKEMHAIPAENSKGWTTFPTILSIDTETYSPNHKAMPVKNFAEHVCYMVTGIYQRLGDISTRKQYLILMADTDEIPDCNIILVKNEVELCNKLSELINELDPDIVTGYNLFGYDYPYLDTRLKRRNKDWKPSGRIINQPTVMTEKTWASNAYGNQSINILQMEGRLSIDLLPIIKRDYKFANYTLNFVSNFLLGHGKHDVKAVEMFETYEMYKNSRHDPSSDDYKKAKQRMKIVSEYCLQDSILPIELLEKTNTWIGLIELAIIVGINIIDLFTRGQQVRCVSQLYDLAHRQGYILDQRAQVNLPFSGGFVFSPVPGLYDNVICVDFNSLYPSIIRAYNICYTTLIPIEAYATTPDHECHTITWNETVEDLPIEENDDDEESERSKTKDGYGQLRTFTFKFSKKFEGVMPQLVKKLVEQRTKVRAEQKKEVEDSLTWTIFEKRQLAYKTSANSLYGFLGIKVGKYNLSEAAISVTAKGRELINYCNDVIRDEYQGLIVYGDTDSTLVQLPYVKTGLETLEWGRKIEKDLSSRMIKPLYLEFEKGGKMFVVKKKKYSFWLYNKQGELSYAVNKKNPNGPKEPVMLIRGMVLARRDNCQFQRKCYQKVLTNVMMGVPLDETITYVLDTIINLNARQIPWDELLLNRSLGANYKSDNYFMKIFGDELKRIGKPHSAGDRIDHLIVDISHNDEFDDSKKALLGYKLRIPESYLESLESDNPEKIDYLYYIEKILINCIEQLISIGYKNELESKIKGYQRVDRNKFLQEVCKLSKGRYSPFVNNLYVEKNSIVKAKYSLDTMSPELEVKMQDEFEELVIEDILVKYKTQVSKLKTNLLTRTSKNVLSTRIDMRPIKMMVKIINQKRAVINDILLHSQLIRDNKYLINMVGKANSLLVIEQLNKIGAMIQNNEWLRETSDLTKVYDFQEWLDYFV